MKRWFWVAFACGIALRAYLAIASFGTDDVLIWEEHAACVARSGLAEHYAHSTLFNHPPTAGMAMAWTHELASSLGMQFKVLYRLLVAAFDVGNVLLLVWILRDKPWRWFAGAIYALSPLAITLAGQHGNLDALVATVAMGAVLAVSSGRVWVAGVLIGLGAWIKLPALLAAPALGFALPRWRERFACAAIALSVGAAPYVWGMWSTLRLRAVVEDPVRGRHVDQDPNAPNVFVRRVFQYQGTELRLPDPRTRWLWGWRNTVVRFAAEPQHWPAWIRGLRDHSVAIALGAVLVLAFLRRRERDPCALGASVALSFVLFYGLVNDCATQYFAWSAPLWLCLGRRLGVTLHVLGGIFVYGFYVLCCQDWMLRPRWRFDAVVEWPAWLSLARDAFNLSLMAIGLGLLTHAVYRALRRVPETSASHPPTRPPSFE